MACCTSKRTAKTFHLSLIHVRNENMNNGNSEWLVETDWLEDNLNNPDMSIIDATWYMPGTPENPEQQFQQSRIPGAVFFNIDEIADKQTTLPHMLPSAALFSKAVSEMGIKNEDHIIIYDRTGIFSAPRVWWTFRTMGHSKVSVLNGGLKKWIAEKRPLSEAPEQYEKQSNYKATLNTSLIKSFDEVLNTIHPQNGSAILDARPAPRFAGDAEEPRPGLKKGHMPGSKNLPFQQLLTNEGTLRSPDELKEIFRKLDISPDTSVITTCGSGITAAILSFALHVIGHNSYAVYDGSWAEWGSHERALIVSDS